MPRRPALPISGPLALAAASGGLAILVSAWSGAHAGWDERPWETAARQLAGGQDPYSLNLAQRLRSEDQTGWPYGPLGLYLSELVYLAVRLLTSSSRPDPLVWLLVALALAAHLLLGREAWKLAGGGWAGALAWAATCLNPFLLRLDASGDVLDLPMLWTLLAAVRAQEGSRPRASALWLAASIGFKQLALFYLPFWLLRERDGHARSLLAAAVLLPALPFLAWDPGGLLFALSGTASAYRNFVQLDWWNQFAFQLRLGIPAGSLRAASYLLTALVLIGLGIAGRRGRGRPLAALAVATGCAWMTYYSAYSLYLGWWSVVAWVLVAASL